MTGFVDTKSCGPYVQLDRIASIGAPRPNRHGTMMVPVVNDDGSTFETFTSDNSSSLLVRPVQIIPAQPDTRYIWIDDGEVLRSTVIAWALCVDGEVRPLTPNGVNDAQDREAYVELPNGRVEAVGEWNDRLWFVDAAAMLAYFTERAAREKPADPDAATGCADDQTFAGVPAEAMRLAVEALGRDG